MNVLLVNPQSYFQQKALNAVTMPDIPLNLACIAAALEGDGHVVRILDINVIKTKEELVNRLSEMRWDIIGFTGTTSVILNCYHAIRVIKRVVKQAKIVLGGWHASAIPVRTMDECPDIDFIVKGEGELVIENETLLLKAGEGVVVEAGKKHKRVTPGALWMTIAKQPHKHISYEGKGLPETK